MIHLCTKFIQALDQKDSSKCEDASSSYVKAGLKLKEILKFFLHILKNPKSVLTSAALQIIVPVQFCGV
tara:strand:+ start:150 stop:356 length:207 start_codon:yes stop_codon:yes gene_type:complete